MQEGSCFGYLEVLWVFLQGSRHVMPSARDALDVFGAT
jgi:hypothetical protein